MHFDTLATLDSTRIWPDAILLWSGSLNFESDGMRVGIMNLDYFRDEASERACALAYVSRSGVPGGGSAEEEKREKKGGEEENVRLKPSWLAGEISTDIATL